MKEQMIDDGTVPFPYVSGLVVANDFVLKSNVKEMARAYSEYLKYAKAVENELGITISGSKNPSILAYGKNVKDKMERLADLLNTSVYITEPNTHTVTINGTSIYAWEDEEW